MRPSIRGLALAALLCLIDPPFAAAEPVGEGMHRSTPRARLGRELGDSAWISTALLTLGLCVVGGLALAARRFTPASNSPQARLIGRVGLSPKHSVYVLQVGRRVLLLGAGPQGAPTLIAELDPIESPPQPPTTEAQA